MTIRDQLEHMEERQEELTQIRRNFHQHPELGTNEHWTGEKIREYLDQWGISYEFPVADTGIVAKLEGKKAVADNEKRGNTIGLRADIDALPLNEDPARTYCSKNPGVMHACGHDAHMTIALGTVKLLKEHEDEWSGCVKVFFQPAEETIGGADRMVKAGCMENPKVDYVLGLHVMPTYEVGEIEIRHGKLNASSDEIHIYIHGKSCHGAYPETGVDAIVMSATVINALQSLVSRNVSPLNNAVFTLGKIQGGTAGNIVAGEVELTGTLRTTDPQTRQFCIDTIRRQVECICEGFGGSGELKVVPGYAALINTNEIVDLVAETASEILGKEHVHEKEFPSLGVEDFSFFLEKAPGAFYHLGCANKERGITAPLHSDHFDLDERCLPIGVRMQTELVLKLLTR